MPAGQVEVSIQRLPGAGELPLPEYATPDAAGLDLYAAVPEAVELGPGERRLIPTGIAIALPEGYEAQIRPRSGLALKHGVTLLNSPGTVDADYRGEIKVLMINLGREPFLIRRGDRVAQLVVQPVTRVRWRETDTLGTTPRGDGGFGHTG
ncbi:MAG TPA: dUTP diphosphatase [Desulfotomaculum sp.]|nr:dUTP diphosphatase [Desulfotomaculum sp.]